MKNGTLFIFFCLFLLSASIALAKVTVEQRQGVQSHINYIIDAANRNDFKNLDSFISPNASEGLSEEIAEELTGKNIKFSIQTRSFNSPGDNKVRVGASYSFTAPGTTGNGMLAYFVFEQQGPNYLLVDTNFHKVTSIGYVFRYIFLEWPMSFIGIKPSGMSIGMSLITALASFILFIAFVIFIIWLIKKMTAKQRGMK